MQATITGTSTDMAIDLPADCQEIQSLRISTGGLYHELHPLPPERLADTLATGYPAGYVVTDDTVNIIGGSGDPGFAMTYWKRIPALSATVTTNWLLLREPGLYLYGALIEASPYIKDDARAVLWSTQYKSILDGMTAEDDRYRYGNAPAISGPRNAP